MDILNGLKYLVNLDAYADSVSYIGYFESIKNQPDDQVIVDVVSLFKSFSRVASGEFWVVSSLEKSVWPGCTIVEEAENDLKQLLSARWMSDGSACNKVIQDNPLVSFKYNKNEHDSLLLPLFHVIMKYSLAYGHVFFYWQEIEAVVYPHDDLGLGFIAGQNECGKTISVAFLEKLKLSQDYIVELKL